MTLSETPRWCPVRQQYAATLHPRQRGGREQFLAQDLTEPHNVVTVRCIRTTPHPGEHVFSIADEIVKKPR